MATPVLPGIVLVCGSTVRLRLGRRVENALLYKTYGSFILDDKIERDHPAEIRRLLEWPGDDEGGRTNKDEDKGGDEDEDRTEFRDFLHAAFGQRPKGESALILRIPRLDGRFAKLPQVDLEDDIFGGGKIAWKAKVRWALMRESIFGDPHTLIGVVWPVGSVRRVE